MATSAVLGGFLALFGFTLPLAVSMTALDAILTPEELRMPEIKKAAMRILQHDVQRRPSWMFAVIGVAVCGLNLYELAKHDRN